MYFRSCGQCLVTKRVGKWIFPCYHFYTSLLLMKLIAMRLTNNSLYVIAQTLNAINPSQRGAFHRCVQNSSRAKTLNLNSEQDANYFYNVEQCQSIFPTLSIFLFCSLSWLFSSENSKDYKSFNRLAKTLQASQHAPVITLAQPRHIYTHTHTYTSYHSSKHELTVYGLFSKTNSLSVLLTCFHILSVTLNVLKHS